MRACVFLLYSGPFGLVGWSGPWCPVRRSACTSPGSVGCSPPRCPQALSEEHPSAAPRRMRQERIAHRIPAWRACLFQPVAIAAFLFLCLLCSSPLIWELDAMAIGSIDSNPCPWTPCRAAWNGACAACPQGAGSSPNAVCFWTAPGVFWPATWTVMSELVGANLGS